jgi:hypothetical protein
VYPRSGVHLLQRDHIRPQRTDDSGRAFGIASAVAADGAVDVVGRGDQGLKGLLVRIHLRAVDLDPQACGMALFRRCA